MGSAADNKRFLERVVDWSGSIGPGYVNLHTYLILNNGNKVMYGWPFQTVDELLNRALFIHGKANFKDAWFCTSRQSSVNKKTKDGVEKISALRNSKNAVSLKALWVDIDVKNDPKHYATLGTALTALTDFVAKTGMPKPSALVNSGGGLHAYWISADPLTPAEWRLYAEGLKALLIREGLKCDAGLTTDDARILRVPGTLNHKYDPPKPVNLLGLGNDYDFPAQLAFLIGQQTPIQNSVTATVTPKAPPKEADIDPSFLNSAPDAAFASLNAADNKALGGASGGKHLVDPTPVFEQCGFFKAALLDHGKDFDNFQWTLSVLGTAFMEDGNDLAHEISNGHSGYTAVDTQALYDRKVADRNDRGIGPPTGKAIEGSGCAACTTCPFKSKVTTPINLKSPPPPPAHVLTKTVQQLENELNLPENYQLNENGQIIHVEQKVNKEGISEPVISQLFFSVLDQVWVEHGVDAIHFRTTYDKGNWVHGVIKASDWCGSLATLTTKLAESHVKFVPRHKLKLEGFLMAWLDKMHNAGQATRTQTFGWWYDAGQIHGFAYGGMIYKDDNSASPAGYADKKLQANFTPTGETAPWFDAAKCITDQQRPELDAIIVAAFAAPLMTLTGYPGATISSWSTASGIGKTYAMEVGLALWGHPLLTKETKASSWKNIEKRLMVTENLPLFWDEITDPAAQKNVFDMNMITTGGVGGGRLTQNRSFADKSTWSTLVIINSNLCFKEYVVKNQPTHVAGLNRVFEYKIEELDPSQKVGMIAPIVAQQARKELDNNFGGVGLLYAQVLGKEVERIRARITTVAQNLDTKHGRDPNDRFWLSLMAAMLVGAEEANRLGMSINMELFEAWLDSSLKDQQLDRSASANNINTTTYAGDLITAFIKDNMQGSIWCHGSHGGKAGRPNPVTWRRLWLNAPMPDGVTIRYDMTTHEMQISRRKFEQWAQHPKQGGVSAGVATAALKKQYAGAIRFGRATLSAGTTFPGGQEPAITVTVTGWPDLEQAMNSIDDVPLNNDLGPVQVSETQGALKAKEIEAMANDVASAQKIVETGF